MVKYNDYFDYQWNPKNHARMSIIKRAAQFAPFQALTGFNEEIKAKDKIITKKIILSEDRRKELDKKIHLIMDNIQTKPIVTIQYYSNEEKRYLVLEGSIKKIDMPFKQIIFTDKHTIMFDDILTIESALFK